MRFASFGAIKGLKHGVYAPQYFLELLLGCPALLISLRTDP